MSKTITREDCEAFYAVAKFKGRISSTYLLCREVAPDAAPVFAALREVFYYYLRVEDFIHEANAEFRAADAAKAG